jgi:hypothetical protein
MYVDKIYDLSLLQAIKEFPRLMMSNVAPKFTDIEQEKIFCKYFSKNLEKNILEVDINKKSRKKED